MALFKSLRLSLQPYPSPLVPLPIPISIPIRDFRQSPINMALFKSLRLSLQPYPTPLVPLPIPIPISIRDFRQSPINMALLINRYYYSDKQMKKKSEQVQLEEEEQQQEVIINVNVPWSELGPDLLGEIVSRLCITDQARFLVVCKNWLAAAKLTTKSSSSLPWLGRIIPGSPEFQIFDPLLSSTTPASIQNISWSNLGIPSPPRSTVAIKDIHHNWLLLSFQKPPRLCTNLTRRYSLMFSPLTKKVITLPGFDHLPGIRFTATFSTQPDSPDCVYCMLDVYSTDKISVRTYRNGDKEWIARQFNKVPGFQSCTFYPRILDGIIYFVSIVGQVASYNILSGEFNFDCLSMDTLLLHNARSNRRSKVFVLNGEAMILYYKPYGTMDPQCIKRYDRSRKVWIPATTLLGYALFFSRKIFNVSLINTKGRRNNGVLPNMIYQFVNGGCHVYSLENGNLVRFGGGELPEYKYNYDGIPDTFEMSAYWLETPCVRFSSDNQGDSVRESCGGGQGCEQ